jgi:hypothetical protein
VVSRGVHLPLQVFYTETKGWGVRCEVDIPIGTFICCYVGRVITNTEAEDRRNADSYLFDLNHFELVVKHLANSPEEIEAVRFGPAALIATPINLRFFEKT